MNEHGLDVAVVGQDRPSAAQHGVIDHGLDLGIIGNGRTAALIDPCSRIVWWCYPRFDGDPIFCRLVSGKEEKGYADVVLEDMADYQSRICAQHRDRRNRTDRPPRRQSAHHRFCSALSSVRPRVSAAAALSHHRADRRPAAHHHPDAADLRIRQAAAASLARQQPYPLCQRLHRDPADHRRAAVDDRRRGALRPDTAAASGVRPGRTVRPATCRKPAASFVERTHDYWMEWVRRLSISYDWQEAIIRAAITLKLSNFDETGGIIAAHTTSIPEAPSSGRTWDYRYCWLRDAYFVVQALNRIGATRTMEEFISFTLSIASKPDQELRPLYSVVPTTPIEERIAPDLEGYRGDGPVRIGNAAVDQVQNDTYGSVILAAMPMFFDRRLPRPGDEGLFHLLESLGQRAASKALEPDAGIWEYRGRQRVHTHSVGDVLGRLPAACRHRNAARLGRPRQILERDRRADPCRAARRRLESKTRRVHRGVRIGRSRRQRAAAARPWRRRSRRSALCLHGRGDGARTGARKARHALCQCRRLRHAGDRVL